MCSPVPRREWAVSSPKPGCKWKGEKRRLWRGWLFYERDRPKNSPRASLKFQLTALEDALTAEDGDREMSSELEMKLDKLTSVGSMLGRYLGEALGRMAWLMMFPQDRFPNLSSSSSCK